ncbi:MAG: cob(I)yrinic acid a,c-diamide adenosyltransferase [Acidimicrobiaceae bacterium]|nr:cob(I)yrinic acid a,c-diamide adenosyltransferase [Acidimicrobiaceae bacterium]
MVGEFLGFNYPLFSVKIYTKKGDDGTTGLLYGGRVRKDAPQIELNGAVDEAQAFLGLARAECKPGSVLDSMLVSLESDLWILMAEVATEKSRRGKLVDGKTAVSTRMITSLESQIDEITMRFSFPSEFVVPGQNRISACLDVARTSVRRAERLSIAFISENPDSNVGSYLNRLSDLVWTMARWQEEVHLTAKVAKNPS